MRWWRLGAAAVVGGLLALGAGGVAAAAGPVTGEFDADPGVQINGKGINGNVIVAEANMLHLKIDGKTVLTYCIDTEHKTPKDGESHTYQEDTWDESKVKNLKNVQWVLGHGYPTAANLLADAQATKPAGTTDDQLKRLLYAGTQASAWHYSDGFELTAMTNELKFVGTDDKVTAEQYAVVQKVYAYLTGPKNTGLDEPLPTLTISPATASGQAGSKIGPFTVTAPSGSQIALTATGGKLVDKDGKPVTTLANGGQFYATSDAEGTVQIKGTGSGTVPIGRVFTWSPKKNGDEGTDKARPGRHVKQKLILAGTAGTPLTVQATATVTAKPTLPVTGASVTGAVVAGLLLLTGGGLAILAVRRRRIRFTA